MKITIGSKTFKATLEDNSTVAKLKTLLPLTLNMTELNGNEKYYHLSTRLPTDAISPGTIQNGDLMLYGNNSLVPFLQDIRDDLQLHTAWADRRSLGPRRCGR
ncbi:MAG: cyclophilin-like fold protein [Thiobacillaceae bacterium]